MPELQPPQLEKRVAPKPEGKRMVTLENVDKPQDKPKQLYADEDAMKAFGLLSAKVELENRIDAAKKLGTPKSKEEIANLKSNLQGILDSLALVRKEYKDEAELNLAMNDPSSESRKRMESARALIVKTKLEEKDESEEASRKLKGKLRLLTEEHKSVVAKNPVRSHELEAEIRTVQAEFDASEKTRIEDWRALAELDPLTYGADAELEVSLAQGKKEGLKEATEQETEDMLASLHEHIDNG